MATEFTTVEVFIIVDSLGDSAVGTDEASAMEAYETTIQSVNECNGFRMVKVTVKVPLPKLAELPEIEAPELAEPTAS